MAVHCGEAPNLPYTPAPDQTDSPLWPPNTVPPADPCPQPPSGLQGIAAFSLAGVFSSFHVPGWLPGSARLRLGYMELEIDTVTLLFNLMKFKKGVLKNDSG